MQVVDRVWPSLQPRFQVNSSVKIQSRECTRRHREKIDVVVITDSDDSDSDSGSASSSASVNRSVKVKALFVDSDDELQKLKKYDNSCQNDRKKNKEAMTLKKAETAK